MVTSMDFHDFEPILTQSFDHAVDRVFGVSPGTYHHIILIHLL